MEFPWNSTGNPAESTGIWYSYHSSGIWMEFQHSVGFRQNPPELMEEGKVLHPLGPRGEGTFVTTIQMRWCTLTQRCTLGRACSLPGSECTSGWQYLQRSVDDQANPKHAHWSLRSLMRKTSLELVASTHELVNRYVDVEFDTVVDFAWSADLRS